MWKHISLFNFDEYKGKELLLTTMDQVFIGGLCKDNQGNITCVCRNKNNDGKNIQYWCEAPENTTRLFDSWRKD